MTSLISLGLGGTNCNEVSMGTLLKAVENRAFTHLGTHIIRHIRKSSFVREYENRVENIRLGQNEAP
jgi:hypothetical protein